uniref:Lysozyme n=1 Tax=Ostrinia furnacalis TaxID=93504 RepID=A9P5Q4_OSTFU|nr:lysozyme precursor [Ostrinia furnacalis]
MARLAVVVLFVVAALWASEAKILKRCDIARELRSQGFPESQMRDWVCLVENESAGNTGKVSPTNKNGSKDYGLFQINDKYWCTRSGPAGKDCHVTCAEVITDDITKASTCAKKIYKRHGFRAWYGWRNHCQGSLPDISNC